MPLAGVLVQYIGWSSVFYIYGELLNLPAVLLNLYNEYGPKLFWVMKMLQIHIQIYSLLIGASESCYFAIICCKMF